MGYEVDIILEDDNSCRTTSCVEDTISALRIQMTSDEVRLRTVINYNDLPDGEYDVFFVSQHEVVVSPCLYI